MPAVLSQLVQAARQVWGVTAKVLLALEQVMTALTVSRS
jgi:hypothetical protein